MSLYGKKRKIDPCPNRLFLSYLKIWKDEAAEKQNKSYHTYMKAYNTLQKYPLPLQSGEEASILKNFGNKICLMLDNQLEKEATERGLTCREYLEESRYVPDDWWKSLEKTAKERNNKRNADNKIASKSRNKPYLPTKHTGAYAIILTLHRYGSSSWMKKSDLQRLAQPLAAKSFTVPGVGSHYTAWSSMSTLLSKNLVRKFSNPAKYELTKEGKELAVRMESGDGHSTDTQLMVEEKENYQPTSVSTEEKENYQPTSVSIATWELSDSEADPSTTSDLFSVCSRATASKKQHGCKLIDLTLSSSDDSEDEDVLLAGSNLNKPICDIDESQPCTSSSASLDELQCRLYPGDYRIVLCADMREISGDKRKKELRRQLDKVGVNYVERVLQVGDFVWLAQQKASSLGDYRPRELVLDYIIERKSMSDLAQSIRDRRFPEQKIRLKSCNLKNIIYLVENPNQIDHQSLPGKTLRQCLINTRVVDEMFVKYVDDIEATASYLKSMTAELSKMYEGKTVQSCEVEQAANIDTELGAARLKLLTLDDFNENSMKSKGLTVSELFIQTLMQINGMSYEKAYAISLVYPTPFLLLSDYNNCCTIKEKEALLSKIKYGLSKRNVGISISRCVYYLFG